MLDLGRTGGVKVLTSLANFAKKHGHNVELIVPMEACPEYYETKCRVIRVDESGRETSEVPPKEMKNLKRLKALGLYLRRNSRKYDAVIANHFLTCYPILVSGIRGKFYYIQAYEPDFTHDTRGFLKKYALMLLAWITYFLPFNRIVNADLYRKYRNIRSSDVVHPGIDLSIFYPKKNSHKSKIYTVGCIGRKEEWKGTTETAKAVSLLRDENLPVNFRVAFNPPSDVVFVLESPANPEELANFYRSIDVLVAPGRIQLGAVHYPVIEAMACGTPVITTGYFPADETNSLIVPINNPTAIAEKIKSLMNGTGSSEGITRKALSDVASFSWENISEKFYSILESKVANTSPFIESASGAMPHRNNDTGET